MNTFFEFVCRIWITASIWIIVIIPTKDIILGAMSICIFLVWIFLPFFREDFRIKQGDEKK